MRLKLGVKGHDVMTENEQHLDQLRAVARMRDNGQFAVATLLRETEHGLSAPHEAGPGLMVLHGIVPAKYLERMKRGQWKRCTELMTTSDLCSALVAGFELGDVQLRLVLPLLGRELREALASLPAPQRCTGGCRSRPVTAMVRARPKFRVSCKATQTLLCSSSERLSNCRPEMVASRGSSVRSALVSASRCFGSSWSW
ncbi:MAG: hypothetical protein RL227_1662 [Pseudomonadota bacterium]|jgi:hypothetical protein